MVPPPNVTALLGDWSRGNRTALNELLYPPRSYDVSPDGKRFLMIKNIESDSNSLPPSMVVVENWRDELKQRVH